MQEEIRNKIKESHYHKYAGIAPEGFMLIPFKVIEELDDFDAWKEFKHNKIGWLIARSKAAILNDEKNNTL